MTDESVATVIFLLFKAVRLALHRNLITYPPFLGFKVKKPEFQIRLLTKEEFERLISTPLESQSQCFIRDLFVFASFTGISYVDLKNLRGKTSLPKKTEACGFACRAKNGHSVPCKAVGYSHKDFGKYRGLAKENLVFPVLGHGRINYALKIIARHCKIDKAISFHQSRHTFASQLCLSQGVPIESVSRMMGHRNIQTTQRYARVNNEKSETI